MQTAPTVDLFLQHIGKPLSEIDSEVFKYAHRPNLELASHYPEGWLLFKRLGFSVTFTDPAFYHQDVTLTGQDPVITNIQIFSGCDDYDMRQYRQPLPHNLAFSMSRRALFDMLGNPVWSFPYEFPVQLDRWNLGKYWILVFHNHDMTAIKSLQIGLIPNKPKPSPLPKILQPDIETVCAWFGKPWTDLVLQPAFSDFDFSDVRAAALDEHPCEVNELKTAGIELYFNKPLQDTIDVRVLAAVRYLRKGIHGSTGFDGVLPCQLSFDDGLEKLITKVGRYPEAGHLNELSGYFVWRFPAYLLHVMFSVLEQRINRIYIVGDGYYSESTITDASLDIE